MRAIFAIVLFIVFAIHPTQSIASNLELIRSSPDGAGPSHIFWLNGPAPDAEGKDTVAVVDPLFAAIRLFELQRIGAGAAADLPERMRAIGVCALPINFRPWRIHHLKDEVRIEGVPEGGKTPYNASIKDFNTKVVVVKRALVSVASLPDLSRALPLIRGTSWNPESPSVVPCGTVGGSGPVGRDAQFSARRLPKFPNGTIYLANKPGALAPASEIAGRARKDGSFKVYSAKELEPAGATRFVQITEGIDSTDGVLRFSQKLLAYGKNSKRPLAEITFDDSFLRQKIGQRPLAVMPSGELLAMGNDGVAATPDGHTVFNIQSCGIVGGTFSTPRADGAPKAGICNGSNVARAEDDPERLTTDKSVAPVPGPATEVGPAGRADAIFERTADFYSREWSVDTTRLDEKCRSADGCKTVGRPEKEAFVPLKGIRLKRGLHSQVGVPYGQTNTLGPAFEFMSKSTKQAVAENPTRFSDALKNVISGGSGVPGNLNDHFDGELGVDCSALVQIAWNGAGVDHAKTKRLTTEVLQRLGAEYVCERRLPAARFLRSGDAIGLAVESQVHHVVLYAAPLRFDGASDFWLVLESSSGCDGVCWSVYDPSFFNGWGLYRAKKRDLDCEGTEESSIETHPIPMDVVKWRELVTSPFKASNASPRRNAGR